MPESPPDAGIGVHTEPMRRPPGGRRGRRGQREHATIDLQGARRGIIEDTEPDTHYGAAVYSTGEGGAPAYHYHRGQQYEQLYAQREDMQVQTRERAPDLKGPGQQ